MVEPDAGFVPPFCPRPSCEYHLNSDGWRFKRDGYHVRQFDRRKIRRYLCQHCQRSFSSQTFSTTYWLKRPDLLARIASLLVGCSGLRQAARSLGVSPSTVAGQAERLGRHALLFAEQESPRGRRLSEPLAADGFESFEYSQYWIVHLNLAVGVTSHFIYGATLAELRRKGAMTAAQKRRRGELEARFGRPDRKAVRNSFADLLRLVVPRGSQATLRTDRHRDYPTAIGQLAERRIRHETTSSRRARNPQNPLFVVNLADLLLRHSSANHKRETIAFSKRKQSILYREAIFRVWRNWLKHVSERSKQGSPAMRLGLASRLLEWADVLRQRLFVTRVALPHPLDDYYWGRVPTRQIPVARVHHKAYAF
jgi:transposase-like protein